MDFPPPPATIADDVSYMADDVGSDSGQSESSTGTVLGPGIQPPGGTHHRRPEQPPGASGYQRNVYRERSMGAPSVPAFSTASTSQYGGDDERSESSYTVAGRRYGVASSRGYGADDDRSESEATLGGPDIAWPKAPQLGVQADLTEVEDESTNNYPDLDAMEDFLEEIKSNLAAIKHDVIDRNKAKIPVWFGAIRLYLNEFQDHFTRLERIFPARRVPSQQNAPCAISSTALAGVAIDRHYKAYF
ncbi:hypothetical protein INS49_009810 [Diaporthe citri]|uniref:uncharacterized protein n=1 Tax=Diaporthe citri TaxID=83186 RepID=UPI001C7ECEA1|nr:uncharacterized protein INS49_009810 [Diaporthe citri]KAG6361583.1 hypothetical protein INS49_009810 [Diaporthe citri]